MTDFLNFFPQCGEITNEDSLLSSILLRFPFHGCHFFSSFHLLDERNARRAKNHKGRSRISLYFATLEHPSSASWRDENQSRCPLHRSRSSSGWLSGDPPVRSTSRHREQHDGSNHPQHPPARPIHPKVHFYNFYANNPESTPRHCHTYETVPRGGR